MKSEKTILEAKILPDAYENDLFNHISDGDEKAFRELFRLYGPLFKSVIYKITNDSYASQDILQEVFLKIWENRTSLKSIRSPRSWALQIVYRSAFNWVRHRKTMERNDKNIVQVSLKHTNEVENSVYLNETERLLEKAVSKLPAQTQKIYRLNHEQDLKVSEIALQMNLSVQTVKNVLGKAMKTVRSFLSAESRR